MTRLDVSNILLPLVRKLDISITEVTFLHGTKDLFNEEPGVNHISGIDIQIPFEYLDNISKAFPEAPLYRNNLVHKVKISSKVNIFLIREL